MDKFQKTTKQLLENFKPIKQIKRVFYPRNFQLSPEFIHAFEQEKKRLALSGIDERAILNKIAKALMFH